MPDSWGIDVYATVRANGYSFQVVRKTNQVSNHFGLIPIDEGPPLAPEPHRLAFLP